MGMFYPFLMYETDQANLSTFLQANRLPQRWRVVPKFWALKSWPQPITTPLRAFSPSSRRLL
jgi:hypothetical protein